MANSGPAVLRHHLRVSPSSQVSSASLTLQFLTARQGRCLLRARSTTGTFRGRASCGFWQFCARGNRALLNWQKTDRRTRCRTSSKPAGDKKGNSRNKLSATSPAATRGLLAPRTSAAPRWVPGTPCAAARLRSCDCPPRGEPPSAATGNGSQPKTSQSKTRSDSARRFSELETSKWYPPPSGSITKACGRSRQWPLPKSQRRAGPSALNTAG